MPDWTRTNRFMGQFLPALMQQKMQRETVEHQAKTWLEKTLREYAAYGEEQKKTGHQQLLNDLIRNMTDPRFFEKRTYPERQMGETIKQILPPELQGQIGYPEATDTMGELTTAEGAMKNILMNVMSDEYPDEADLEAAIRAFGYEAVLENIKTVSKNIGEKMDREMRGREATIQESLTPIRKEEVGIRKGELELEKTGKPKKGDEAKRLKELQDDIDSLSIHYYKVGIPPAEKRTVRNQIMDKVAEAAKLKETLGIEPDPRYRAMAEELQRRGFTREDLISNAPLIKKLSEQGYSNWKVLEFF